MAHCLPVFAACLISFSVFSISGSALAIIDIQTPAVGIEENFQTFLTHHRLQLVVAPMEGSTVCRVSISFSFWIFETRTL